MCKYIIKILKKKLSWIWFIDDAYAQGNANKFSNQRVKTRKKNWFRFEKTLIAFNIDDNYIHFLVFQLISPSGEMQKFEVSNELIKNIFDRKICKLIIVSSKHECVIFRLDRIVKFLFSFFFLFFRSNWKCTRWFMSVCTLHRLRVI